ncbi:perforin-1.3 [Hoplias malabaricus]|uniref:perforin-1.3 n=1 Tax=Hoplias malabaricus TaxID=27720 RepID=UPI0034620CF7
MCVQLCVQLCVLLTVLCVPQAGGCRTGHSTECDKPPFVPGHNLVGEGFNVVHMKSTGAFVVNVRDYMSGGHSGNCTLCENRLLGGEQKVPAAVQDWRVKVLCRRDISATVFDSSTSALRDATQSSSTSWKVGLSMAGYGLSVGGTHSKSAQFAKKHASKDKFSYTKHTFSCTYYSFRLHSRPPLTKEFLGSLKALPTKYNSQTKAKFENFIAIYGTHFLRQVNLGGKVQSLTAVRTCQVSMNGLSVRDVSNCLSAEAGAIIKGVSVKGQAGYCKNKSNKLERGSNFSMYFKDRMTEVLGGDGSHGDLLFAPDQKNGYAAWMKTLKKVPGVVSYSLSSLHMLVRNDSLRKTSLQQAIRDYIIRRAVSASCSSKCPIGHRSGCGCKCSGHQRITSNCCPSKNGIATLSVRVERAAGLWGDYFSKTDGYVKVFYGSQGDTTPVIWNNNFPVWNRVTNFGTVDLTTKTPVKFEVWDRDNRWDDDLLGTALVNPYRGVNVKKSFRLKHGTLYVSLNVVCAPNLTGSICEKYAPSPEAKEKLSYLQLLENHRPVLEQRTHSTHLNRTFL